jgi:phosphoribosyl 1,2-cyclic phosphodiesterase
LDRNESRPLNGTNGSVSLRFWGTRGSIPSPGPATAHYGGNTSCLELRFGEGKRLIFDAGSGLRSLGQSLVSAGEGLDETVFLSHFHWDHIQGFPFFAPLYRASTNLQVVGPAQQSVDVRSLFAGQMGPVYFPVPFNALSATIAFHHLNEGAWEGDGYRVRAMRVRHPSYTVGYRAEVEGVVITYVPDNELVGGNYDVPGDWQDRFDDFVRGSDVLVHDSMYTNKEYRQREGWGHSTFEQTLSLARRTKVPRLFFFHHSPERTDTELATILQEARDVMRRSGCALRVDAADEGEEIVLEAGK